MTQYHDPIKQVSYLQQCLSHDKKPIGLFISAGCPFSIKVERDGVTQPLIPDILGMTNFVCNKLDSCNDQAFTTVMEHFNEDGYSDPNIEKILSHIRALRQVSGAAIARGLTSAELDKLDKEICSAIIELVKVELPDTKTPYNKVAMWIRSIPRADPVELFTTNYDLLVEQALEALRVPFFDGFIGSHRTFFDALAIENDLLPPRWARLWKLHGSINWQQDSSGTVSRGGLIHDEQLHVIHPSHLKYDQSRRMPYLALIDRLRAFFKKPSAVLITSGYSFGDKHLNVNFIDGLQSNPTAIVFALVHGKLANYSKAISIASERVNFNLLAEDAAIIGTKQLPWLRRDSLEINAEAIAIEWDDIDGALNGIEKQARFMLGDFSRFGDLLEDIIGMDKIVSGDFSVE